MTAAKYPWFKFFPADWRADPALRMCGLAARGLWAECMCLMHEAEPYGHLIVNGHTVTETMLANLTGAGREQVTELLGELESAGVFSRTRKGVIYSRRMTRDDKKTRTASKNGKLGGNPTLSNIKGNQPLVNPPDKPPDKGGVNPICQKLDTRRKKKSEAKASDKEKGAGNGKRKPKPTSFDPDSQPGDADFDYAAKLGFERNAAEFEAESFATYNTNGPGAANKWLHWWGGGRSAFGNWLRNSAKRGGNRNRNGGPVGSAEQPGSFTAAIGRAIAQN
jgi:hypothetical protein